MRSELFRIPLEVGGLPLFGVGVLLGVVLVVFGGLLFWRAQRHGVDQEFWGYLTPAAIACGVVLLTPRFAPEGVPIRGYGVMLLVAIATGLSMAVHRARERGIAPDTVLSLAFWLFVLGIFGARLFFVIEYWETRFAGQDLMTTLVDVVQFTEGGLVVYGSLIGAGVAFMVFTLRHKLPVLGMADVLAPALAAGLAIGRIGCFLNGCCYGGACDLDWAVTFPKESPPFVDQLVSGEMHGLMLVEGEAEPPALPPLLLAVGGNPSATIPLHKGLRQVASINGYRAENPVEAAAALATVYEQGASLEVKTVDGEVFTAPAATNERSLPVHPTQLYSAINAGLLAWLLWSYYPSRSRDGEVILLLLTIYPISRFLLEVIRTDEDAIFGTGLSISQNVSIAIFALALLAWPLLLRTRPRDAAQPQSA